MASELRGFDEWERLLDDIAKRSKDLSPADDTIHRELAAEFDRRWDLNEVTGRLRESVTNTKSRDHIWKSSATSFELGSKDPASVFNELPEIDATEAALAVRDFLFFGER